MGPFRHRAILARLCGRFEKVTTRSSMVFHAHVAWCPVVQCACETRAKKLPNRCWPSRLGDACGRVVAGLMWPCRSRSECSMSCDFTLARLFKIEVNGEPQGRRKGPTLTVFHFASSRFFFDAATSSSGWQTPLFLGFQLTMARTKLASICIVLAVCTALRNLAFLAPAPQTQLRGSATESFDVAASAAVPILLTPAAATAADGEGMPSVVLGVGVLCALAAFSVVSSVISATVTSELD